MHSQDRVRISGGAELQLQQEEDGVGQGKGYTVSCAGPHEARSPCVTMTF